MLRKARHLACGAAAALALIQADAATITINVGASQSLANSLVDLIGSFQAYYFDANVSYNVAVTVDTNANLKAAVVGSGTAPAYDLVLTDDEALAGDLKTHYSAYIEGAPFVFARDLIDLYSVSVDVSHTPWGLPIFFTGPVVIADPKSDAYGKAAATLLAGIPWFIWSPQDPRVAVQPDVATVKAGVELGLYPYGLLAKSAICSNTSGTATYPAGSSHYEYVPLPVPLPGLSYRALALSGVKTARAARTADQATELTDFINFLMGVGTTQGTDVLKRACYLLP